MLLLLYLMGKNNLHFTGDSEKNHQSALKNKAIYNF